MKSPITPKSVALCFLVVLVLYLAVFYAVEYGNHRKGPWEVSFVSDQMGNPSIVISQAKLNISTVEIVFTGEKVSPTNLSEKVLFDKPLAVLPFQTPIGEVIYEDVRALPGVITFNVFGHEIELLPRVLVVNKKEIPWKSEMILELAATNKPAQPPKPPKGWNQNPPR